MSGILGKKLGMSRIVSADGNFVPVTYVEVLPNEVVQIRTPERDGYSALVLGIDPYARPSKNTKFKFIKEVPMADVSAYKVGQTITLADLGTFEEGHVTAISKGKGFQGGVRRWNFTIARKTHGQKYCRHGSTMSTAKKGGSRSRPGIHMSGHMGCETVTLRNRKIVAVYADKGVYAVKGAVPGAADSFVTLKIVNA